LLQVGIHSFPARRSALKRDNVTGDRPASSLVMTLEKALNGIASAFEWLDW